ncbi:hypothetical protein L1987_80608 [Smallanthus sonchifolius]|uniref:Uncharacterized protein n=1 Tax=Smallanthus sonchifolius TaxID=185202 RepID=A0ACB8YNP6_9ASTR|nr:hypothetical protein L1987_80608 [Smallanthus sonchifolius]
MYAALALSATVYVDVAAQEAKEKAEKAVEVKPVETKRKSEEIVYQFKPWNFKFPMTVGNNSVRNPQEVKCGRCQKTRHVSTYCPSFKCFNCNEMAHIARNYTKPVQQKPGGGAKGRVFVIGEGKRNDNAKVVAGMKPTPLDHAYVVETTSGEKIRITESYANCKMTLGNENSMIELMPMNIADIPVVCDHPDVFPKKLPGLPLDRQIEFRIELIPGAKTVAKAPYCLAPFELKELMKQIQELLDKDFIRPMFIEDNLILSRTQEDHAKHLQIILETLRKEKLYSKFTKCEFWKQEIATPLTTLTQKALNFEWSHKQEEAFKTLKQKLSTSPILALPGGNDDFVIYCDASRIGLGCVLMQ